MHCVPCISTSYLHLSVAFIGFLQQQQHCLWRQPVGIRIGLIEALIRMAHYYISHRRRRGVQRVITMIHYHTIIYYCHWYTYMNYKSFSRTIIIIIWVMTCVSSPQVAVVIALLRTTRTGRQRYFNFFFIKTIRLYRNTLSGSDVVLSFNSFPG